ncbi:ATP-binding protein [Micromonospora sp. DPT]|uniref:ATP-binding protein n=1 Tax=Micromonospora sp. DPT TaxID=3142975 RepID=UPI00320AA36A
MDGGHDEPIIAPRTLLSTSFDADGVTSLRHTLAAHAQHAGLTGEDLDGFVIAVHELVINAVLHGGRGRLNLRDNGTCLTCEVTDSGRPAHLPATIAAPGPTTARRRGLWLAKQLTDDLQLDAGARGLTASVTVHLPANP